jgi:hypothetical protein
MFYYGGPSGCIGWENKFTTFHVIKNKSWVRSCWMVEQHPS